MTERLRAPRFVLTHRDLAMLQSIHAARYLTAQELEWLHFPTWWARYAAWTQAQGKGSQKRYMPSAQLYSRLRGMQREKLIDRIHRPVKYGINIYKRDADLFKLTRKGGEALVDYAGIELDSLQIRGLRSQPTEPPTHTAMIGAVYAALRAKIEATRGLRMRDWRNDMHTAQRYDRIEARVPGDGGSSHIRRLPIQPDGVFVLHGKGAMLCFIEVERDRSPDSWKRKVYAWEAYKGSHALKERYGHETFLVLAISETKAQGQTRMRHTAQALWQLYGRHPDLKAIQTWYLFATETDVHPTTIGTCWQRIKAITPHPQRLPSGGMYERVTVEAEGWRWLG